MSLERAFDEPTDWTVVVLSTDNNYQVMVTRNVSEVIPHDGSFKNGWIVAKGMTEKNAREFISPEKIRKSIDDLKRFKTEGTEK